MRDLSEGTLPGTHLRGLIRFGIVILLSLILLFLLLIVDHDICIPKQRKVAMNTVVS
jgi:hypothetical protein